MPDLRVDADVLDCVKVVNLGAPGSRKPRHSRIAKVAESLERFGRHASYFEAARLLDIADVDLILRTIEAISQAAGDLNDLEQIIVDAQRERYRATGWRSR